MGRSTTHLIAKVMLTLLAVFMISSKLGAQPFTYVPGWTGAGAQQASSYTYFYNYPEEYYYIYGYYMWYDYMNRNYSEFVVLAADMKAAGLCAGPVSGMSLKFIYNPINWNANYRIFMRSIGTNYWIPYTGNTGGNPYYYTWCIQRVGGQIGAHPNAVEVYSNPSWTLGQIPQDDTTWVDWEFNKDTFIWDGTSNIAIGMFRCNNSNMVTNYDYADIAITHVRPPNPPGYSSYWPWITCYDYTFYGSDCNTLRYRNINYLYYYSWETYVSQYKAFRPEVRLQVGAGISQSYPDDIDPRRILKSGDNYNGGDAAHPKPSLTYYEQAGKLYKITYKIVGPSPSTNTVYTASSGGNSLIQFTGSSSGWKTYTMSEASGTYASSDGSLNLTSATGGSYKVVATLETDCGTQQWTKSFVVAFPNDVAMAEIRSPKESPKKNPLNVTLPLSCQIQNVGLNDVTNVDVEVTLRTYPGGQQVYNGTQNWQGNIGTGERAVVDFTSAAYVPTAVGKYTAEFCATLKNATDQQAFNDCLPLTGDTHIYEVNYNQEGGAYQINRPSTAEDYYANRPFQPMGTIQNNGILDGSNWPVRMEIFKMPGMQKVYTETVTLQSIDAAAPNNYASIKFPLFTPDAAGDYRACMKLMTNDPDGSNDELCRDFTVYGNMSGTYTIGLKNIGKANNYPNFELAVNDLYLKGVSGPVKFELTDNTYTIQGTAQSDGVALDLSGYVPGMSAQNTVSFVPSLEQSLTRGSITITLNSLNGVGVLFGQNLTPTNPQSLARQFPTVRSYSNSAGHYIFDGGSQRSIRVNLSATTPFRAPFYLGDGSQHIVLKNMLIGNASNSTPSYANSLPRVFFTNGQFTYEQDVRSIGGQTYTYSGGIVDRNKMPVGSTGNNSERLDTIAGKNNQFIGNEISGFGYGVVSLGIGTLLKGGVNEFRSYYSTGTQISGNVIYGCGRAGIVAGYQDGLQVMGNRIYSIGQISSGVEKNGGVTQAVSYADDACGILLGGNNQYNVLNTTVSGNEISGIRGQLGSRGIVVDQVRNSFQSVSAAGGMYYAPNGPEHTLVASNTVWGLSRNATTTHMGGIHVLTGRSANDQLVPAASDYFTRQDTIANNTVVMTNDNVSGTGAVFAIGTQHGNGTAIFNNAIAMQGTSTASSILHAGLFYEGTLFRGSKNSTWYLDKNAPAAMVSNNNAFYTPNSSIAQFVEVSASSEIVSSGSPSEFKTMGQWRSWTSQDINSVEGNFTTQLEYRGVAPSQKLRINITPKAPIGSILNDRGIRIASITKDIDGEQRGATGLGYDIGADEFGGRLYVSDLEAVDILKPTAYRSTSGATSDAEYIMTTTPVDVTARIRNSGSLPRTDADIRVRIWVETAASNNGNYANPVWSANTVVDQTYAIDLNSGASTDIVFGIQGFAPQTYQQLVGYTVPSRFSAMALNVTPRYRIEVSTPNDENNGNNSVSKVTRFYIKRSGTSIMVSGRYVGTNLAGGGASATEVAGRLNSDTLIKALNDLGFYNNPAEPTFGYDVMDRNAWEARAVDYTIYRTLFWAHDQTAFTRGERDDLRNFIAAGTIREKKNLAIGSQEPVRRHVGLTIANDENFVRTVLRATNQTPGEPATPNYHGKKIVGRAIARNSEETVSNTSWAGDASPRPALMQLYSDGTTSGIALTAYSYKKGDRTTTDSIAGTATASLTSNRVYIGIDWRHFARTGAFTGAERVLRGTIDFFEKNGGTVVPVELVNFDAKSRGNNVDVFWATASEQNADHFTVERQRVEAGKAGEQASTSAWSEVATVAAAGNSTARRDYGIVDRDLQSGLYQYRLNMVDRDGSSSNTGTVEVLVGSQSDVVTLGGVQPNPVRTQGAVTVTMAEAAPAMVTVIDASGRTVATLHNGMLPAGATTLNLTATTLASGVYTVVAQVDGVMVSTMVTIAK